MPYLVMIHPLTKAQLDDRKNTTPDHIGDRRQRTDMMMDISH